jgi:hypothetical protein
MRLTGAQIGELALSGHQENLVVLHPLGRLSEK